MKFETVRIHFLSDVLVCCHPEILLPWQRDVTTSPLHLPKKANAQLTDASLLFVLSLSFPYLPEYIRRFGLCTT